jgi:hypothetical protein
MGLRDLRPPELTYRRKWKCNYVSELYYADVPI